MAEQPTDPPNGSSETSPISDEHQSSNRHSSTGQASTVKKQRRLSLSRVFSSKDGGATLASQLVQEGEAINNMQSNANPTTLLHADSASATTNASEANERDAKEKEKEPRRSRSVSISAKDKERDREKEKVGDDDTAPPENRPRYACDFSIHVLSLFISFCYISIDRVFIVSPVSLG
jgi:hypothetical protein